MSYTKTNWQNLPNQTTPVNATNLNKIEQGIYDNDQAIQTKATLEDIQDNLVNVSNEVDEDYRVNVLYSHNLFNKNSFNKLNGYYVSESQSTISQSGQNMQTLYISIVGGKTYTVSKVAGVNFRCATTQVLPAPGVTVADQIDKNTATSITITTSLSAKYLCVSYYSNTETQTEQTILNSIMINEGSTVLPYEPYIVPSIYVDNEEIYSKGGNITLLGQINNANTGINLPNGIDEYNWYILRGGYGNKISEMVIPKNILKTLGTNFLHTLIVKTYNGYGAISLQYVNNNKLNLNGAVVDFISGSVGTDTTSYLYGMK